jgi:hypothetical protein
MRSTCLQDLTSVKHINFWQCDSCFLQDDFRTQNFVRIVAVTTEFGSFRKISPLLNPANYGKMPSSAGTIVKSLPYHLKKAVLWVFDFKIRQISRGNKGSANFELDWPHLG